MLNSSSKKLKIPWYSDYGSFILCRPSKSYKIYSNINIIKADRPILYDIGIGKEILNRVNNALKLIKKKPGDVEFVVISHIHFDHCTNLIFIKKHFPNCKVIFHENFYKFLTSSEKSNPLDRKFSKIFMNSLKILINTKFIQKNKFYTCKDNDTIPHQDLKLRIIHTPGHSSGHVCLLDSTNKVLFLGDMLPYTPWVEISSESIDNMVYSIKKLLKLSSKKVHYSVRNHGNLKDNWKEFYAWEEEREKFEEFLDLISYSLEKIVVLLKKTPLSLEEIAFKILKNKDYRDYSKMMNLLFISPNLSWIMSYLLKLKKENKIKQIRKKWVAT
ncbi:MAG: MBL fold metallo-hydrolase [Promethearchaeota archaeon]